MDNDQMILGFNGPASVRLPSSPKHSNYGMYEPRMYEVEDVAGLYYFPGFLSEEKQCAVTQRIDSGCWRNDLDRRVQHYGWRYDYRARTVTPEMKLGPLPVWIEEVANRLYHETRLFDSAPGQAIVNEYEPGQGIALHVDRECFGPTVATISLGDDWEMKLRPNGRGRDDDKFLLLARGSALIMTGEARSHWMHGIDKRKTEDGGKRRRQRRLSLTFRTVIDP